MTRMQGIEPFRVMALLERARELEAAGRDIVHLEVGEPDLAAPQAVTEAAQQALADGVGGYTPSTGLPALQTAIADRYQRLHGLTIDPARILITPGASGAFNVLYLVLLEQGGGVLLPDPGYPCHRHFVQLAGGVPMQVPVGPDSHYHLSHEHLIRFWKDDTRAAVVTSPGNPTGTLIEAAAFNQLAAVCRDKGGYLISDEIYTGLSYNGQPPLCALSLAGADPERTVVVDGFSKRWSMTGWRVGWMVVPEALIDPCRRVMQNLFISSATLSQQAALAALDQDDYVAEAGAEYDRRRRYLLAELPRLGLHIPVTPTGAFYVYADTRRLTRDAEGFCQRLLEEAGVALTPGADFGRHRAAHHVRFAYATSMERLQEGVARLADFVGKYGPTPPSP